MKSPCQHCFFLDLIGKCQLTVIIIEYSLYYLLDRSNKGKLFLPLTVLTRLCTLFLMPCSLSYRSYGSVYKALHKESGQVLAIKQVPIDTDLQEIIKEISIMQQCDSPHVVKYYGSYFKDSDLWVCIVSSHFFIGIYFTVRYDWFCNKMFFFIFYKFLLV